MSVNSDIKKAKLATLTKVAGQTPEFSLPQQPTVASGLSSFLSFAMDIKAQEDASNEAKLLEQEMKQEEELLSGRTLKIREARSIAKDGTYTSSQLRSLEEKALEGLTSSQKMQVLKSANTLTNTTTMGINEANQKERDADKKERDEAVMTLAELAPYVEPVEGVDLRNIGEATTDQINNLIFRAKANKADLDKKESDLRLGVTRNQEARAALGQNLTLQEKEKTKYVAVSGLKFRTGFGFELLREFKGKSTSETPELLAQDLQELEGLKDKAISQFQANAINDGFTVSREEAEAELKPLLDTIENYKAFISGDDYFKIAKNTREILTEKIIHNLAKDNPVAYTSLLLSSKGLITRDNAKHLDQALTLSDNFVKGLGKGERAKAKERLLSQGYSEAEAEETINLSIDMVFSRIGKEELEVPLTESDKDANVNLIYNSTDINSPNYEENLKNGNTRKSLTKILIDDASPSDFPEGQYERVLQSSLNSAEDFLVRAATRVKAGEIGWDGERFVSPQRTPDTTSRIIPQSMSQVIYLNQLLEGYSSKSDKDITEILNGVLK